MGIFHRRFAVWVDISRCRPVPTILRIDGRVLYRLSAPLSCSTAYYRAVNQPGMSVVLTNRSLGPPQWHWLLLIGHSAGRPRYLASRPIGWALADFIGIGY